MRARSVLGRGGAPVVWWALEGALLLEHVEDVKLRKPHHCFLWGYFHVVMVTWSGNEGGFVRICPAEVSRDTDPG